MNLGQLIDYVGNLLDYDPTNETYRAQLVAILNDAQTRILTDRPWDFAMRDRTLRVWTDTTLSFGVVNGSATVSGSGYGASGSTILPGSDFDRAVVKIVDSTGMVGWYTVAWVETSNTLYLDRDYEGTTGTYTVQVYRREVYLPSDCVQVENVSDPSVGIPRKALFLSKWEREDVDLDPSLLGVIEGFIPSEGTSVPAPSSPRGVSVYTAGAGQGVRTVNVWMANVHAPSAQPFPVYPREVSDGRESPFSAMQTFTLTDTQSLQFTPETIPSRTGLYRRYYFTCPEAGIVAPVRVRNADSEGGVAVGVDTVNPKGTVTLRPNLALGTLAGQSFQSTSVRYRHNQAGVYQSIQLYPHPSGDQHLNVRMLIAPALMQEDQDAAMIPAAYAQVIAYAALENLTLKVGNPALSAVYQRKRDIMARGMEQAYLKAVPRRLIKGTPTAGTRFLRNPFGPLRFS